MNGLRIFTLIIILNASKAYAGQESSAIVIRGVQQAVRAVGIFCFFDGMLEMSEGKSFLPPIIAPKKNTTINGTCKLALGALIFVAGQPK